MSQINKNGSVLDLKTPIYHFSIGIFKVDYKAAGYVELLKIVKEWAKDENFRSLILRKVSKDNFGIQFIYINHQDDGKNIDEYRNQLKDSYGVLQYASDYHVSTGDDLREQVEGMILVSRPIE